LEYVLTTVILDKESELTFSNISKILGVPTDALDYTYGIQLIDPEKNMFAVRLNSKLVTDIDTLDKFSDPKIGTLE